MIKEKEHAEIKLDMLLVRIIRLKNRIIELIKRILRLKGKIPDAEIVKLMQRLEYINNDYDNEDKLKQDEVYVNKWEKDVDRLEKRIEEEKKKNTVKSGKEHKGPKP